MRHEFFTPGILKAFLFLCIFLISSDCSNPVESLKRETFRLQQDMDEYIGPVDIDHVDKGNYHMIKSQNT